MKGPLRALIAIALAGVAAAFTIKARERRRALDAGPPAPDPPVQAFDDRDMGAVATGEGMPEAG